MNDRKVRRRNVISDQTKANLQAAEKVRITPQSQSELTSYYVVLVGKTGKIAHVENTRDELIIYDTISAARRQLKKLVDLSKIEVVSQFDID